MLCLISARLAPVIKTIFINVSYHILVANLTLMTLTEPSELMGKRELVALLNLSSWCLVMVKRLFLAVQGGCLRIVIVVFSDHAHLLF